MGFLDDEYAAPAVPIQGTPELLARARPPEGGDALQRLLGTIPGEAGTGTEGYLQMLAGERDHPGEGMTLDPEKRGFMFDLLAGAHPVTGPLLGYNDAKYYGNEMLADLGKGEYLDAAGSGLLMGASTAAIVPGIPAAGPTLAKAGRGVRGAIDDLFGNVTNTAEEVVEPILPVFRPGKQDPPGPQAQLPLNPRPANRTTVAKPLRKKHPGIYDSPERIVERAKMATPPESPLLQEVFGVSRRDLDDITREKYTAGLLNPERVKISSPRTTAPYLERLTRPSNARRIMEVIDLAEREMPGNYGWYEMSPIFEAAREEIGEDAAIVFIEDFINQGVALSANANVMSEMKRNSIYSLMKAQGRGDEFMNPRAFSPATSPHGQGPLVEEFPGGGHTRHSSHVKSLQRYRDTGDVMGGTTPGQAQKYRHYQAAHQDQLSDAVMDAHNMRAIGAADVRPFTPEEAAEMYGVGLDEVKPSMMFRGFDKQTGKTLNTTGMNATPQEYSPMRDWWKDEVAAPLDMPGVPAQALTWNAFAPATGVTTPVGIPKAELLLLSAKKRAIELGGTGTTEEVKAVMRGFYRGQERLGGILIGGAALGAAGYAATEEEVM